MGDTFVSFITTEYDALLSKYIVRDCPCYDVWRTEDGFLTDIFKKRKNYFACAVIPDIEKYGEVTVNHKLIPILLGSDVDKSIRRAWRSPDDRKMYGAIIVSGVVQMIPTFMTNNIRGGHVYANKRELSYKLTLRPKVGNDIPLVYTRTGGISIDRPGSSDEKPTKYKRTNEEAPSENNSDFISVMIEMSRHYMIDDPPQADLVLRKYTDFWDESLEDAPDIDSAGNKTFITVGKLFERAIHFVLWRKGIKRRNNIAQFLRTRFETGGLFFAISNKNTAAMAQDSKTIYMAVDGQKLDKIHHLCSTISRFVNNRTKNSSALFYPADANKFICPVTNKDMKGAGENLTFSMLTISSPRLDPVSVVDDIKMRLEKENIKGGRMIAIDGWLTFGWAKTDVTFLEGLKKKWPTIAFRLIGSEFLNILTKGGAVMRFDPHFEFCITPYEHQRIWANAFEKSHPLTLCGPLVTRMSNLTFAQKGVKITVSVANLKGHSAELTTPMLKAAFERTIGYHCALAHPAEGDLQTSFINYQKSNPRDYTHQAILSHSDMVPPGLSERFDQISNDKMLVPTKEIDGFVLSDLIPSPDLDAYDRFLSRFVPKRKIIAVEIGSTNRSRSSKPLDPTGLVNLLCTQSQRHAWRTHCQTTENTILGRVTINWPLPASSTVKKNYELHLAENNSECENKMDENFAFADHCILWAAFGDVGGGTNEDGIVLDEKLSRTGPKKLVSITLQAKVQYEVRSKKITKLPDGIEYSPTNQEVCGSIIFGTLHCAEPLKIIGSPRLVVNSVDIKGRYRYILSYEDSSSFEKCNIWSDWQKALGIIFVHYEYYKPLGVGHKLSNKHGQKGVCSKTSDLSKFKFWTREGQCVHPQVLYSPVSVIGRVVASQILAMKNSSRLAISMDGSLCAPLAFFIHHIDDTQQSKVGLKKIDLMTMENGFVANQLSFTLKTLSNQRGRHDHGERLAKAFLELCSFSGGRLTFISHKPELLEGMIESASDDDEDDTDFEESASEEYESD